MKATIRQVAELAGVSITTVSHVLNCKEGTRVRQETQSRVLEAAKKLNYHTSGSMKPHTPKRTGNLGLLVPSPSKSSGAYTDLIPETVSAICNSALQANYNIILEHWDHIGEHRIMPQFIKESKVDGCMVVGMDSVECDSLLGTIGRIVPLVSIDREMTDHDCVLRDNFKGAISATNALLTQGCRSIICLCPAVDGKGGWEPATTSYSERVDGFVLCLARSGIFDAVSHVVPVFGAYPSKAISAVLASGRNVDGILSLTDGFGCMAEDLTEALGHQGIRHVRFVDSHEKVREDMVTPYIHIDVNNVAENAVKLLLGRIQGNSVGSFRVVVKADLVSGPSTASPLKAGTPQTA